MKSLIQHLFEALVNRPELEKNLKFEETTIQEILDILDTDEYKHFEELSGEVMSKDDFAGSIFLFNKCTPYKIMYEDKLVGVFSIMLPKELSALENDSIHDYRIFLQTLTPIYNAVSNGHNFDIIDKSDYANINMRREFTNNVLSKTAYIGIWQISPEAKKKIDINQIALIKVFFEKLLDILKSEHVTYVMAHGKDKHRVNGYAKVGGFTNPIDIFKEYGGKQYEINPELFDGFVIKHI
jgi:hypothetical protein